MQAEINANRIAQAADLLRLIGNPNRLAIVLRLSAGEASVGEMETGLGIRQPTLSQQLGELRKAGLIDDRREGKAVFYRLTDDRARAIANHARDLFVGSAPLAGTREMAPDRQTPTVPSFYASVFARVLESAPRPN